MTIGDGVWTRHFFEAFLGKHETIATAISTVKGKGILGPPPSSNELEVVRETSEGTESGASPMIGELAILNWKRLLEEFAREVCPNGFRGFNGKLVSLKQKSKLVE
ncbi:hypothetical protein GOBAR_DD35764 [Gossypium barbadense]|nr:hypothetical protein GOBAR_DD35764 [Gossypium barbadense]